MFREQIKTATLVANPGCYPTATVLGLAPLLVNELIAVNGIIADAKSGVSGAGKGLAANKLFGEVADDFKAYAVDGHRHHPEIIQTLNTISNEPVGLTFVPHLLPTFRGIHATIYAQATGDVGDLTAVFRDHYAQHPCVDVLNASEHPRTASVTGSNTCRIAVHLLRGSNQVVVLSVIDNLVKGAAGQAVQNANLMFGLPETLGLNQPPLFP